MLNNVLLTTAMLGPQGEGQANPIGMFMPMILIFGIFYFMLIRPQQRKEKERRQMIEKIKSGDRIVFSGGILGTVTNVKDGAVVVKIADNVKIELARGGINRVLEKGEKPGAEETNRAG